MKLKLLALLFIICCFLSGVALAQDESCSQLVQTALETTADVCSETGRNEACYGNISINVEAQPGADEFVFEQRGDTVSIVNIRRIALAEMQGDDIWGVALLRVQANLPDTLPGQNVTVMTEQHLGM